MTSCPSSSRQRLLFVMRAADRDEDALSRMLQLSRSLRADLHVLSVFPPLRVWLPRGLDDERRSTEWAPATAEATREWLDDVSADHAWSERYALVVGHFASEVVRRATSIGADLVAISSDADAADSVAELACATRLPVLLDRPESSGRSILAATDLEPDSAAVLQVANDLGRRLLAPVVALYNSPFGADPIDLATSFLRLAAFDTDTDEEDRLARAARRESVRTTVLARERSAVEGIVRQARASAAGIVVVGARRRHWVDNILGKGVVARVASRCPASVIVVPLGQARTAVERHEHAAERHTQ